MSAALPELPGVSKSTIEDFLRIYGAIGAPHGARDVRILAHKGRCIEVYSTGSARDWHECAEVLIGGINPAEEFRGNSCRATVRLKTDAQREADNLAFDLDEQHGELRSHWPFFDDSKPTRQGTSKAPSGKKRWTPAKGSIAEVIWRVAHELCEETAIPLADFYAGVKAEMPEQRDGRGKDRREERIKQSLKPMLETGRLFLSGDDDMISVAEPNEDDDETA